MTALRASPPDAPGGAVLAAARGLGLACGIERSVKLAAGRLLAGRFLVSLPQIALEPSPRTLLLRLCAELGAPEAAVATLLPQVGAASHLHLGSEIEADGVERRKVYLEFATPPVRERDLVFLAVKWRVGDAAAATTRYERAQGTQAPALIEALAGAAAPALRAVLAAAGSAPDVLVVTEPGAARRSIDLGLYDAGLALADVAGTVRDLFAGFGLDAVPFLAREGGEPLGHLAAGTGRDGAPFATLYFGARELDS